MVVYIEMVLVAVVCPNIFRGHPIIDHFLFEGPSSWLLSYADQLWMTTTTTVVKSEEVWDESSHSFSTTYYYTFKGFFFPLAPSPIKDVNLFSNSLEWKLEKKVKERELSWEEEEEAQTCLRNQSVEVGKPNLYSHFGLCRGAKEGPSLFKRYLD